MNEKPNDVVAFIDLVLRTAEPDLASVLGNFRIWRYPRGDLHSWIAVLDRFDGILEDTINTYELFKLQLNDFTPKTKELVLEMLRMTRLLMENCTNRKLFSSYDVSFRPEASLNKAIIRSTPYARPRCSSCNTIRSAPSSSTVQYSDALRRWTRCQIHTAPFDFEPGVGTLSITRLESPEDRLGGNTRAARGPQTSAHTVLSYIPASTQDASAIYEVRRRRHVEIGQPCDFAKPFRHALDDRRGEERSRRGSTDSCQQTSIIGIHGSKRHQTEASGD